ncbi:MAG: hypothetical protein ACXVP5_04295 [Tumebacillaceae bacterium]
MGGIKQEDVAEIIRNGANGVAIISAIIGAEDVQGAAQGIRSIVDRERGNRA